MIYCTVRVQYVLYCVEYPVHGLTTPERQFLASIPTKVKYWMGGEGGGGIWSRIDETAFPNSNPRHRSQRPSDKKERNNCFYYVNTVEKKSAVELVLAGSRPFFAGTTVLHVVMLTVQYHDPTCRHANCTVPRSYLSSC